MSKVPTFVFLLLVGCADSSYVLIGAPRAAVPVTQVQVYTQAPPNSIQIALLKVDAVGWTSQSESNNAIGGLKKQAARLGANGVLLTGMDTATSGAFGNVNPSTGNFIAANSTSTVMKAIAIFVPTN
jgi:uncharacterized protein YbjQ (UPF0145 family)